MTTHQLYIVFDHRTGPDRVQPEIVACTIDEYPADIARIPIGYAECRYLGKWQGEPILPRTSSDNRLIKELDEDDLYLEWLAQGTDQTFGQFMVEVKSCQRQERIQRGNRKES